MSGENLGEFVRFWARAMPNREALIHDDATVTWAELNDRTTRLSNGLRQLGVGKGDRIGLIAPNCVEYLEIVIASYKLGAVTVPLNHRLTASELSFILEHAGCKVVVSHGSFSDVTAQAVEALTGAPGMEPMLRIGMAPGFGMDLADLYAADDTDVDVHVDATDVAYICYTSGTTGLPKGAMLTHGNVLATATFRNLADNLGQQARLYLPAPLSFTGTLVMLWGVNYVGGGVTVLDTVVDPKRCLEVIDRHAITDFVAVPVILERMVRDPQLDAYDLSSLRTCLTGGANVTESFLRQMWDNGIPVRNSYGLTEGSSCSTWQSLSESQQDPASVGHSTIFNEIKIVDHNRAELVDLPVGEVGEIVIRGPEVMLGYWEDPTATAATLVDGWLRTGDLGLLTDAGFLHVVGRVKDMLISGGINVYPAEIEEVLATIDGVLECSVIGVADEVWGETPAAIVHPAPDRTLEPAAIRQYCSAFLADYKLPRYVVIRDEPLPRNMSGKILKRVLQEEYSGSSDLGSPLR